MEALKELFEENRIKIKFRKFDDWSGKGLKLSIILDNEQVYEGNIIQKYYED